MNFNVYWLVVMSFKRYEKFSSEMSDGMAFRRPRAVVGFKDATIQRRRDRLFFSILQISRGAPCCFLTMDSVRTANFDVVDFLFLDSQFKN
jgi:hypothetical protein